MSIYKFTNIKLKPIKNPLLTPSTCHLKLHKMLKDGKIKQKEESDPQDIFLSIDHLDDGNYIFKIMLDDKIVKSFKLKK